MITANTIHEVYQDYEEFESRITAPNCYWSKAVNPSPVKEKISDYGKFLEDIGKSKEWMVDHLLDLYENMEYDRMMTNTDGCQEALTNILNFKDLTEDEKEARYKDYFGTEYRKRTPKIKPPTE